MDRNGHRLTLFSQRLDRIAFVAYFLGAVVPLSALAFELNRGGLRGEEALGSVALLVSVSALSLGGFLALRRTIRHSLRRMADENVRLSALLEASRLLAAEARTEQCTAADIALGKALEFAPARLAFLVQTDSDGQPAVIASGGLAPAQAADLLDGALAEQVDTCLAGLARESVQVGSALVLPLGAEHGAMVLVHSASDGCFEANERDALRTLAGLTAIALANTSLRDDQRNFFSHVVELLNTALDAHLGYHDGHGHRVARQSNLIAHELGLDEDFVHDLHFAALLHDIGMLRISRSDQATARGCEPHPRLGYEMLRAIRIWEASAPLVLHHHEWWDGSGYPEGLSGEEIPLGARIITVCESFDSMTCAAGYRERLGFADAVEEIRAGAGTQFDPRVVAAFLSLVEQGAIEPDTAEMPAFA